MSDTPSASSTPEEPEAEGQSLSHETETELTTEAGTEIKHGEQTEVEWPPEAADPAEEPAEDWASADATTEEEEEGGAAT